MDPGASLTVNEPRGPRRRPSRRRLIRWTLVGLAALVLLLGVGVATAWILFRLRGPELIRAELEGALVTALGRPARVDAVTFRPWPVALRVSGVAVASGASWEQGALFRLEHGDVSVRLESLWRRRLVIAVTLTGVEVTATAAGGGGLALPLPPDTVAIGPVTARLAVVQLRHGRILYRDPDAPWTVEVRGLDAEGRPQPDALALSVAAESLRFESPTVRERVERVRADGTIRAGRGDRPERAIPVGGSRGRAVRPATTDPGGARRARHGSRGGQPGPDRQPRRDDLAADGHRPVRRDARGTGRRAAGRGSHHRARARRGAVSRARCPPRGKLRGRDLAPSGHSRRPPWRARPGRLHPEPRPGSRHATGPPLAGRAPAPGGPRVPRPGERAGRRPARRGWRDRARAGDRAVGRRAARRHGPRGAGGPPGAPRGPRRRSRTARACDGRDGRCGTGARDRGDDGDVGSAGRRRAGRRGPPHLHHAHGRPRGAALPAGEQRRLLAVDRDARDAARRPPRGADRGPPRGRRARRRAGRGPALDRPRAWHPADAARDLGLGGRRTGGGGPRAGRARRVARTSRRRLAGGVR